MPESSQRLLSELREKGSPVLTFVEEACRLDRGAFTSTETLFEAWKRFCDERELSVGKVEDFVTALKSAVPELTQHRQRVNDKQQRGFKGIAVVAV